jgi:hypothetical protein
VRARFVPAPEPDDEIVEVGGLRIFVARSILDEHGDVEIDVTEEHETLMVRPLESKT